MLVKGFESDKDHQILQSEGKHLSLDPEVLVGHWLENLQEIGYDSRERLEVLKVSELAIILQEPELFKDCDFSGEDFSMTGFDPIYKGLVPPQSLVKILVVNIIPRRVSASVEPLSLRPTSTIFGEFGY